ncbi:MAG: GvpL/GvpF family gas vesicle protein [Nocardiopsaceae bacterium]|nr:GvpL/GvpF family gas vesicle protein [Nocardiopsaceae bacterium]
MAEQAETAVYVYGIVPADTEVEPGTGGVGDPPGEVRLVRHRDLAALVSDVPVGAPLGRPEDLVAHEELLDAAVTGVPVLPLRFGAVVTDDEAVSRELLDEHHDEFAGALKQLEGRAEYVVKGRYAEGAIMREVLQASQEAAELREQIKGTDENATRYQRIRLGEIVSEAVSGHRERDTRAVGDALDGHVEASLVREPTHELDAVHTAFLAETGKEPELERALDKLARDWEGRIELRLLGPLAAYDFVGAAQPDPED